MMVLVLGESLKKRQRAGGIAQQAVESGERDDEGRDKQQAQPESILVDFFVGLVQIAQFVLFAPELLLRNAA